MLSIYLYKLNQFPNSLGSALGYSSQHVAIEFSIGFPTELTVSPAIDTTTTIKAENKSVFAIIFTFFITIRSFLHKYKH